MNQFTTRFAFMIYALLIASGWWAWGMFSIPLMGMDSFFVAIPLAAASASLVFVNINSDNEDQPK